MTHNRTLALAAALLAIGLLTADVFAQRGPGGPRGRGGPGFRGGQGDPQFAVDRDVFHFLLANGNKIRREVKNLQDGVETVTESDDPEVAAKIQEHVAAMYERVEKPSPIHMRDPLFAEVFRNYKKIEMKFDETEKGIKVVETSKDPYVARLIQAHAEVVSLFVKNGFDEAHRNHAVPGKMADADRDAAAPDAAVAVCQGDACKLGAGQAKAGGCCQQKSCCKNQAKPCDQTKPCGKCNNTPPSVPESTDATH